MRLKKDHEEAIRPVEEGQAAKAEKLREEIKDIKIKGEEELKEKQAEMARQHEEHAKEEMAWEQRLNEMKDLMIRSSPSERVVLVPSCNIQ